MKEYKKKIKNILYIAIAWKVSHLPDQPNPVKYFYIEKSNEYISFLFQYKS